MKIRKATTKDISGIIDLYTILFSDMAKLQPGYFKVAKQDDEFIRMIIENEDSDILIAYDTKIIGLALVQKQKTPPYNCLVEHNFAYLMDLVVEPVFRNKGIGKKLIESVKKWALEKDCKYIELNVLSQNDKAIALYKAMDFDEEMKTMRMKL